MIGSDAVRVVAVSVLVAVIALGSGAFWPISVIAFVEGSAPRSSWPRIRASLRSVVAVASAARRDRSPDGPKRDRPARRLAARRRPLHDRAGAAFRRGRSSRTRSRRSRCSDAREVPGEARATTTRRFGRSCWKASATSGTSRSCGHVALDLRACSTSSAPSLLFAIVVIGTDQGLSGGEVGLLVASCSSHASSRARSLAVRPAGPTRPGRVRARALDVGRLRRLSRLAERLCARGEHAPERACHALHRRGRPRLPDRDDARPAARPSGVGLEHLRDPHGAVRAAHRRACSSQRSRREPRSACSSLSALALAVWANVQPGRSARRRPSTSWSRLRPEVSLVRGVGLHDAVVERLHGAVVLGIRRLERFDLLGAD